MSEIHAAFAEQGTIVLPRLDELLALLQDNLADPVYGRACDLLRAMASPQYSAALHDKYAAPGVVDVPYVAGTGTVGQTLTCTMGNWTGEPTEYAYQWRRDGTTDIGTGAASYLIVSADAGHQVTCIVTATNGVGSSAAPPSNSVMVAPAK
jgi:hypothetical protein